MAGEKEYIVITKKGIDIAEVEAELERDTSADDSASTNVPTRTVDVAYAKKANNRITHYMLNDAEAAELSKDSRIHAVHTKPKPEVDQLYETQTAQFDRSTSNDQDAVNWGLKRHIIKEFDSATAVNTYSGDYTYSLDGTGVDIVIQDDGVDPTGHPEWEDANGQTRFVQLDWYAATGIAGTMPAGHYTNSFSDGNNAGQHGSHVAGIAAGKTYGWAKGAKIYSVRKFGGTSAMNDSDIYDVIRVWHEKKPIDPNTGFKRPTIVNQSWGSSWFYNNGTSAAIQSIFYKGVDQSIVAQQFTTGTFVQYGCTGTSNSQRHPLVNPGADVEQEQLTDAGVICIKAAGNGYHPCSGPNAPYNSGIYDSYYTLSETWAGLVAAGQPIYYNRHSSPHSEDTLFVANMDRVQFGTEEFIRTDSERGPRIDVIAGGDDISSATSQVSIYGTKQLYPGSSTHYMARIGGTSMAAPQICGIGALWLQANPGGTAQQFKDFLKIHGTSNCYDSGTAEDFNTGNVIPRRYGAPSRVAHWPYNSPNPFSATGTSGSSTPGINT
ncbi:MAG: hypothetical protein CMA31_01055 [Euryarchaeota archaeon]|nr:hypothetical protein [Euryarchaeota archaeon]